MSALTCTRASSHASSLHIVSTGSPATAAPTLMAIALSATRKSLVSSTKVTRAWSRHSSTCWRELSLRVCSSSVARAGLLAQRGPLACVLVHPLLRQGPACRRKRQPGRRQRTSKLAAQLVVPVGLEAAPLSLARGDGRGLLALLREHATTQQQGQRRHDEQRRDGPASPPRLALERRKQGRHVGPTLLGEHARARAGSPARAHEARESARAAWAHRALSSSRRAARLVIVNGDSPHSAS